MDKYTIMKFKVAILYFFLILCSESLYAQLKYSNDFLQIGAGARSFSLSKSVVASVDGPSSIYWNPSSLVEMQESSLEIMHAAYFGGIANYDQISYVSKYEDGAAYGFMIIRLGIDDIMNTINLVDNNGNTDYDRITLFSVADYACLFSYAKSDVFLGFDVGGNAKIIYRKIGSFANSYGFGFDISAQKKINTWKFAAIIRDATSTYNTWIFDPDEYSDVYLSTGNEVPVNTSEVTIPSMQIGVSKLLFSNDIYKIHSELDFDYYFDGLRNTLYSNKFFSINPHFGSEFVYKDVFAFRFGLGDLIKHTDFIGEKYFTIKPSFGIGFDTKNIIIDYALANFDTFQQGTFSHIVSLTYNFK